MVEVIHRFHDSYPFGLEKETQNTFVLILKENLSEKQIALYRQKNKILKEVAGSCLIKMQRILKEDNNLHLIYEYYPLSLAKYIQIVNNQSKSPKEKCRTLTLDFNAGVDGIIEQLTKLQIKADIFLCNLAVALKEKDGMQLKVFIEPQAQFLSLIEHHYRPKQRKRRDISTNNQQFLAEFYEAERKRLNMEFQQLLEHHFGKIQQPEKKHMPNFVINGTKLLFISPDKEESQTTKNSKIQPNKPKQIKQKIEKKVEQQPKKVLSNPQIKGRQQATEQKPQAQKKKIEKIVNFDQSFQPEFKPQEFTNENTYIMQEHDYLQSLQEELVKLASEKKLIPNTLNKFGKTHNVQSTEKSKEQTTAQQKKANQSQKSIQNQKEASKGNPQNSSASVNHNQSNSNVSSQDNNSYQGLQICKIEPKQTVIIQEKVFKYKMKIITSHQIEIEGDGQPNVQEIQREIMQGIKTGKLNINDLAANKKTSQNRSTQMNNSNNSNQNSKEGMTGSAHTQKLAPTSNFMKDNGGKVVQSSHQGAKMESNLNNNTQVLQTRSSDLQEAKMKIINDIIQKIGINRVNQAQNIQQCKQSKPVSLQQEQCKSTNMNHAATPDYKTQKVQINEEKTEKADNYLLKIKEAKEKAEHILKQYAKKKQ